MNNTFHAKNDIIADKKIKNIYINNNFSNNIKKHSNVERKKKETNDNININGLLYKDKRIRHFRYNSNLEINKGNKYLSETNYNLNFKKKQSKKSNINKIKLNYKDNNYYISKNEDEKNTKKILI